MKSKRPPGVAPIRLEELEGASATLSEARQFFYHHAQNYKGGVICPCCDRFGVFRLQNVNSTMARGLIWLVEEHLAGDTWIDVPGQAPKWLLKTNQLSSCKHWGLVLQKSHEAGGKKKKSGFWKPTAQGIQFVRGEIEIIKYAIVYNDKCFGFQGDYLHIEDCLGEHFDYWLARFGNG